MQNIYQKQLNLHILVKNLQNTVCVNIQHTSYFSLKCNFVCSVFVFYPLCFIYINSCHVINLISGVMVSMLTSTRKDRGFEPRSGQTKDYKIDICCFSAKHAALRRKGKDWFARNQNNVSEWSDMSSRGLLFQCASMSQNKFLWKKFPQK